MKALGWQLKLIIYVFEYHANSIFANKCLLQTPIRHYLRDLTVFSNAFSWKSVLYP